jgi:hypothetical protein
MQHRGVRGRARPSFPKMVAGGQASKARYSCIQKLLWAELKNGTVPHGAMLLKKG